MYTLSIMVQNYTKNWINQGDVDNEFLRQPHLPVCLKCHLVYVDNSHLDFPDQLSHADFVLAFHERPENQKVQIRTSRIRTGKAQISLLSSPAGRISIFHLYESILQITSKDDVPDESLDRSHIKGTV